MWVRKKYEEFMHHQYYGQFKEIQLTIINYILEIINKILHL